MCHRLFWCEKQKWTSDIFVQKRWPENLSKLPFWLVSQSVCNISFSELCRRKSFTLSKKMWLNQFYLFNLRQSLRSIHDTSLFKWSFATLFIYIIGCFRSISEAIRRVASQIFQALNNCVWKSDHQNIPDIKDYFDVKDRTEVTFLCIKRWPKTLCHYG